MVVVVVENCDSFSEYAVSTPILTESDFSSILGLGIPLNRPIGNEYENSLSVQVVPVPKKLLALLLTTASLLVLMASPAFAAKDKAFVVLLTEQAGALDKGGAAWIPLMWESQNRNLQHFRVVATTDAPGVVVAFPSEGTYSGLWENQILAKNEIDFTAINLTIPADFAGAGVTLTVTAAYGLNAGSSKITSQTFSVYVPVVQHTGDDLVQVSDNLGTVVSGSAAWVGVQFKGLAPLVTDFKLEITDADGVPFILPQGSFTSLDANDELDKNETDVARMYLDASELEPGTHRLEIRYSWMTAGEAGSSTSTVTVEIVPGT